MPTRGGPASPRRSPRARPVSGDAVAGSSLTREEPVTARDVDRAARRISDLVRETPVLSSGEISRRVGAEVILKAESLQRTGSFKLRGAAHKLSRLTRDEL